MERGAVVLDPRRFVSITSIPEAQHDLFGASVHIRVYQGKRMAAEFETNDPLSPRDIEYVRTRPNV